MFTLRFLIFKIVQGTLIAPGTDPAAVEVFGHVYTVKSTKYYHVSPVEGVNFDQYVGKLLVNLAVNFSF